LPEPEFDPCAGPLLQATHLQAVQVTAGDQDIVILEWNEVSGATGYEVQEAAEPAMVSARSILAGEQTRLRRVRRFDRITYFRVRARRGDEFGPWSNTAWDVSTPATRPVLDDEYDDAALLDVQRALLRMCAARGDLFALLALPAHYREAQALAHATALSWRVGEQELPVPGSVPPFNASEVLALSYGALYHPWLFVQVEGKMGTAVTRQIPPHGSVCGTFAKRAISRGAWVAPANERLSDVVSLVPKIKRESLLALFRSQINMVRQDPRGFLVLSADTLSPDAVLKPINVRRLLILLRRLAMREGLRYVFQNNDASFRQFVRNQFDRLLADLYVRGAFAGATPDQAYQVVVDERINTRQQVEQGRLIVELRVAPSRPMAFITIRLVQTGYEGLSIEEL
jgi:phage tail sheath protein FI